MSRNITLSESEVNAMIQTIKGIKPRGFNSMDKIVGLVMFLQNKVNDPTSADEIVETMSQAIANQGGD